MKNFFCGIFTFQYAFLSSPHSVAALSFVLPSMRSRLIAIILNCVESENKNGQPHGIGQYACNKERERESARVNMFYLSYAIVWLCLFLDLKILSVVCFMFYIWD